MASVLESNSLLQNFRRPLEKQSRDKLLSLAKILHTAKKEEHFNFRKYRARQIDYQGICKRRPNYNQFRRSAVRIF